MTISIRDTSTNLLLLLQKIRVESGENREIDGKTLCEITRVSPPDLNDAIAVLQQSGYVEWRQYIGTAPFIFGHVWITPAGRYEAERILSTNEEPHEGTVGDQKVPRQPTITLPPTPIGSPYGFKDEDWEYIAQQKDHPGKLNIVFGYQFSSTHYDSDSIQINLEEMLERAVIQYNNNLGTIQTELNFHPLSAGYGEHLFNEIARDIIAADIAIFETSDLNPNVMVELGVALTWGVRVLPIKVQGLPRPPSDISGQTWADYRDNAKYFVDPDHEVKLVRMIERAVRKKGVS